MMPETQTLLTALQIQQKIKRIAYQILEDNVGETALVLAGINNRGYITAKRIEQELQQITKATLTIVNLRGSDRAEQFTAGNPADSNWMHQPVILVDDVVDSGKTMTAALGYLLKNNHPKIRTAVLVDRSHKVYPLAIDFAGLRLSTVMNDHVEVQITTDGHTDMAYLV